MSSANKTLDINQGVTESSPSPGIKEDSANTLNFATRWIENARFTGGIAQAAIYSKDIHDHPNGLDDHTLSEDLQIGTLLQNGSGLIVGIALHFLLKRFYTDKRSLNPLYRNFKTLATFGMYVGQILGYVLPLPHPIQKLVAGIITDASSLLFGLAAIPYWLVRAYVLKTPDAERNQYTKTGTEGWSKYAKTFLVIGACIGQAAGAIYSFASGASLTISMGLGGVIAGVAICTVGMVIVPLVNRYCSKAFVGTSDGAKDKFRNNYVRSGVTLGMGIGATIGFFVGTFLCPGIGSAAGMTFGGAIGATIGGTTLGVFGQKITTALQQNWKVPVDSENSWDYATRNTSYVATFLFAAIGFFLPVPGGALVGAALGAAAGNAIGWGFGLGVIKLARKVAPGENKAKTLPWTQRVASGATMSSIVGAGIGFTVGLLGGPIGAAGGAVLGGAIGGVVGAMSGALSDDVARSVMKKTLPTKKSTHASIHESLAVAPLLSVAPSTPRPKAMLDSPETEPTGTPPKYVKSEPVFLVSEPIPIPYSKTATNSYRLMANNSSSFKNQRDEHLDLRDTGIKIF